MNLTLGFIAFFISIIIPGILYRRFFFFGEFSKQFNTKDPVLHSIFFSIVPGIIIQLLSFVIYFLLFGFKTDFFNIFLIFQDITSDGTIEAKVVTQDFINNDIVRFIYYSLFVFILASVSGWSSSRLIRNRNWDKNYKLFRFKNQWYYIFSGEVLNMKKFEEAHKVSFKNNKGEEQDILMTYADILVSVSEQNDKKELYTGYVVDYDLKSDDITQLDKVYLIDTHRYKKKEKFSAGDSNNKLENKSDVLNKSRNRIKVPGDIFVLNAKNIVNLNLTYVPSLKKIEKKKEKEIKHQKRLSYLINLYIIIISGIVLAHFFHGLIDLDDTFLKEYLNQTGFWGKLLVILLINQILSIVMPSENSSEKISFDFRWDTIKWKLLVLLIWGFLNYFFVFRHLF
ncbi:hypothetical protein [Nonlabens sp. Asnod3-A02]|uniref:hypothetical protein n=1 Tax=Nonlabens sp. Asnod3-A02 TaxID=3160579 RepID=UPI00386F26DF